MNYWLILMDESIYDIKAAIDSGEPIYWHNYSSKGYLIQEGDKLAITNGKKTLYKSTVCNTGSFAREVPISTAEVPEIYRNHWKQGCDYFYKINEYNYVEISKEGEDISGKIKVSSIKVANRSIGKISQHTYEGL